MPYEPPTSEDLHELKNDLGKTRSQMATMAHMSVAHWRRCSLGERPQRLGYATVFLIAATLSLPAEMIAVVEEKMRAIGAKFDSTRDE